MSPWEARITYRKNFIRVDLGALKRNVQALRRVVAPAALMAVVKADAYGHGLIPAANAALEGGASMLGVAIPEEGEALREADIDAPILVLGGVNQAGADADARLGLIQTVYDAEGVTRLQAACDKTGARVSAHLKIDTGMGRIGVRDAHELTSVLDALKRCPDVRLTGAFTHFSDADGQSDAYAMAQLERFDALCALLPAGILRHAAASAAMLRFPKARFDMVRAGIVMYGCPPDNTPPLALEPALSWRTEVTYVKTLPAGQSISYGRTFLTARDTRVATLAVGYGDGYHRALSNRGVALIGGRRRPILGRVCMDQIMVDVTDAPDTREGDEAVLIGRQGDQEITAGELAGMAGTISYEVLLAPTRRVPREYITT